MKSAFLFPGQGSQYEGMLSQLPKEKEVQEILYFALQTLGKDIEHLHSKQSLLKTTAVQQCLLIAGVSTFEYFKQRNILPNYLAGHSVGAFSAAVAAEVLSFENALKIVTLRGRLMEAYDGSIYGMGVVIGMKEQHLVEIVRATSTEQEPVYVSNRNAPTQLTLSGTKKGINNVFGKIGKLAKTKMLAVSTPSHCPLFKDISLKLHDELNNLALKSPKIPIISNANARLLKDSESIKKDLAESISNPVQWYNATSLLVEHGVELFIELPPGDVLTKLATSFENVRAVSVEKNSIEDCLYLMQIN